MSSNSAIQWTDLLAIAPRRVPPSVAFAAHGLNIEPVLSVVAQMMVVLSGLPSAVKARKRERRNKALFANCIVDGVASLSRQVIERTLGLSGFAPTIETGSRQSIISMPINTKPRCCLPTAALPTKLFAAGDSGLIILQRCADAPSRCFCDSKFRSHTQIVGAVVRNVH